MNNYDDLLSRFDEIQDLPISEEMLGAYIEGNLNKEEMTYVGNLIQEDSVLSDFMVDTLYEENTIIPASINGIPESDLQDDIILTPESDDSFLLHGEIMDQEMYSPDFQMDDIMQEHEGHLYSPDDDSDVFSDDSDFTLPELPFF